MLLINTTLTIKYKEKLSSWRKAKSTSRDYKYHKAKTTHSTYLLQDFHELIFPKILKSVLIYGCKNYIWNHYNKHKCKSIKIYPVHIFPPP